PHLPGAAEGRRHAGDCPHAEPGRHRLPRERLDAFRRPVDSPASWTPRGGIMITVEAYNPLQPLTTARRAVVRLYKHLEMKKPRFFRGSLVPHVSTVWYSNQLSYAPKYL